MVYNEYDKAVGERIREIRKEKGLTQKALGEMCGMSESQVSQYEIAYRNPSYKTLLKFSKALNIPVETFLFANGYIAYTQKEGIGERIREARFAKGMSREELAEICGVDEMKMGFYELGVRSCEISRPVFSKIAETLNVSENYLIFGTEKPTDETTTEEKIDQFFYELRDKANSAVSTLTQSEIESLRVVIREYLSLNDLGRQKVYERIEELLELPKYTK